MSRITSYGRAVNAGGNPTDGYYARLDLSGDSYLGSILFDASKDPKYLQAVIDFLEDKKKTYMNLDSNTALEKITGLQSLPDAEYVLVLGGLDFPADMERAGTFMSVIDLLEVFHEWRDILAKEAAK